jgi:hypothetical protein
MAKHRKDTVPPAEIKPLDVETLDRLIDRTVLRGPKGRRTRYQKPDEAALEKLVANINGWRASIGWLAEDPALARAREKMKEAARLIREAAPKFLEAMEREEEKRRAQGYWSSPFGDQTETLKAALTLARQDFGIPPPTLWRAPGVGDKARPDWRHFAKALLDTLNAVFGTPLPLHSEGPAVRLIAALIPYITGELLSWDRVSEVLRQLPKEAEKEREQKKSGNL